MSRCKIFLKDQNASYLTGSEIVGTFECYFTEAIKVRDIKLLLECREHNKWQPKDLLMYSSEDVLFHPSAGSRTIHRGRNCFPFEVHIPIHLPSTYEGSYGSVQYTLEGIVDQLIWSDMRDKINVAVVAVIDLDVLPRHYLTPKTIESHHVIKTFCCYNGYLSLILQVPRLAFIPGDVTFFKISVKNMTTKKIFKVELDLIETKVFTMVEEQGVKMNDEIIFKIVRSGADAKEERNHEIKVEFPGNMRVNNFNSCSLIRNFYTLRFSCHFVCSDVVCIEVLPKIGHRCSHSSTMSTVVDKNLYILPNDQPVVSLEVSAAFQGLSNKEKLYAHFISLASWHGNLITLLQTSPESGPIFVLLHKIFSEQAPKQFAVEAANAKFAEEEIQALFVYTCGIFSNAGNYKGFGDTKFIPNIDKERLELLLQVSPAWNEVSTIWYKYKEAIYDLSLGKTCLGFPPAGRTTYLSQNCGTDDNRRVQEWFKHLNLEGNNTRLFKTIYADGKIDYEIRVASEETGQIREEIQGKYTYRLIKGDYSPIIGKVADYLENAATYAANDTQAQMLKCYSKSFKTGTLNDHKDGSRFWIKDKGPTVESYIGFIETYRDPAGLRGEFEGFVAVVNRPMSEKFTNLVEHAEEFLPLLPWPRGFEKDEFLRPDFTSLDVLTFASSGIPAGINIPNYDDIRQTEGFKNVSLGNVIPASYQMTRIPFLSEADAELMQKWRIASFELQVGLHELLGHGSGKLLIREKDGTTNYPTDLLDPLTGNSPSSAYEKGDTYDSVFGQIGSSYEECRAEAVGLYLSLEPSIVEIFGHKGQEADDVVYVNWLSLIWNGVGKALEMWDPTRGWLQAHAQARFVLARVLIQAGVVSVTEPSDGDLLVTLDRSAVRGAGRNAIGHFLLQLQTYKATADIEAAEKLYNHYSTVVEPWVNWRSIVLANKQPRKIFIQPNTALDEAAVSLKTYDESLTGMIDSWVDRFSSREPLYEALIQLSEADERHFV